MDFSGLQWIIVDYSGLQWIIVDYTGYYSGLQWIIVDQDYKYPVVNGGSDSALGYPFSLDEFPVQQGAVRSYLELRNHLIEKATVSLGWITIPTQNAHGNIRKYQSGYIT